MSDDTETACAATPRETLERHILDVNVPKSETEWWAHHEIISLRRVINDRWEADKKAAKAIFAETGRTSGFPSVKEVVAFYVAEVGRLEGELKLAQSAAEDYDKDCIDMRYQRDGIEADRDTLRAKLERVLEQLKAVQTVAHHANHKVSELSAKLERAERDVALARHREDTSIKFWMRDAKEALAGKPQALRNRIALFESPENSTRVVLSELSADAPAQQTQISDGPEVTKPEGLE